MSESLEFCRPAADNSPFFSGVPKGGYVVIDGIMYVRQSDWLPLLYVVTKKLEEHIIRTRHLQAL